MKQIYVMGGVLLLVAVAGYGNQMLSNQEDAVEEVTGVMESATLMALAADVEMTSPLDAAAWKLVTDMSEIADGAGVRTSVSGRAVITHEASIVTAVNSNSEIRVALNPEAKQTRVELVAGETWSKVERALEQDEVYEVYTPTLVAAVRGTSFGVSTDPNKSLVVTEGVVQAQVRDPETGEPRAGTAVSVRAGETLTTEGDVLRVRPTTEADKDTWYILNNPEAEAETMIQIDPPTLVIPATSQPPAPAPVVPPPTTPAPAATTTPTPPPAVITEPALTVTDVTPRRFTYGEEDLIRFTGIGLDKVIEVEFNGDRVDFIMSRTGVLGAEANDLPNKDEVYDVVLRTVDDELTLPEAVEVLEFVPEVVLEIESVLQGGDPSLEQVFIRVLGPGMGTVDTVLINNQPMEFSVFSDTELHVFDVFATSGMTVEVRAGTLSDQFVF